MSEYIYATKGEVVQNMLSEVFEPLQEIVRCRDCRFYKCGDDGWWCLRSISTKSNHPDGFCALGRKAATMKSEDSRELLEADIEEWASIMDLEDQIDMIHGWLNRRAAIVEREMVKFNRRYFDCVEQEKKIAELTAERDELQERIVRCRDCRFSLAHGNGCGRNQDIYDVEPDGFCAWGERKERIEQ